MTKFKFNCASGSISLSLFINNLAELEPLTKDEFVKEKIIYANKLLTDNNYSIKILNENKKEIENDILEIYRYRNMIVHDAHFNEQFLQYYVKLSEKYARHLLLKVVNLYCKDRDKLIDILLQEHLNFKMLLLNLDQNKDIPLKEYIINNKL